MLRFNTILFPVDFSERAAGAARYVRALSDRFGSKVILFHVLETHIGQPGDPQFGGLLLDQVIDLEEQARNLLRDFMAAEFSGDKVERKVVRGLPAATILTAAIEENADLVVIPTHGYGGFRRLLFGSTAATVLHRSPCPVLTGAHLEHQEVPGPLQIRQILCPLDLTAASLDVLRAANDLAVQFNASLILLHAVPGTNAIPEKQLDCELRRHLMVQAKEQLLSMASAEGVEATLCVEVGDVAEVIERVASSREVDLVVTGRNHGTDQMFWQQRSYEIARRSPTAVISV